MNIYLDLFTTFFRTGACTFGGGYAMLPILQRDVVENKGWATDEELTDYFAIGQCTPGVIAVNTATFIGYKYKGILGGIAATLGIVCPSVIIITIIALFLRTFADLPAVAHAFSGIRACVCTLILNAALKIWKSALIDLPTALIFVAVFFLSVLWGLSPSILVIVSSIIGLGFKRARGWNT